MFLRILSADPVHELSDGPYGLASRGPDLCWNKSYGVVGRYERKIWDFTYYFGSHNLYVWSFLWDDKHRFANSSVDTNKPRQKRLIGKGFGPLRRPIISLS